MLERHLQGNSIDSFASFTAFTLSLMFIFSETCFSIHFIAVIQLFNYTFCYQLLFIPFSSHSTRSFVNFPVSQSVFPSTEDSIFVNEGTKQQFISTKCFAFYSRNEHMKLLSINENSSYTSFSSSFYFLPFPRKICLVAMI